MTTNTAETSPGTTKFRYVLAARGAAPGAPAFGVRRLVAAFQEPSGFPKRLLSPGDQEKRRQVAALVRLGWRWGRAVKVRLCAVKNRAVSNRNCVVATRGGEQRNENDQSVTQTVRVGRRRELDSVGVDGRACERKAKPVGAGANPLAAGRSPVVAPMVGDGMVGSPKAETRETRPCWRVRRAYRPRAWLAGVRASVVAEKRVTTVERRERRKVEVRRTERRKSKPTRVPARASQWWNQPSAIGLGDTERLTDGLGDEAKSRSLSTEHPPTGKPDAGEPPVRFGGRGSGHVRSPYPYRSERVATVPRSCKLPCYTRFLAVFCQAVFSGSREAAADWAPGAATVVARASRLWRSRRASRSPFLSGNRAGCRDVGSRDGLPHYRWRTCLDAPCGCSQRKARQLRARLRSRLVAASCAR